MPIIVFSGLLITATALFGAEQGPSFSRDIRPILTKKCFACHGPDETHREGDLRLDDRAAAIKQRAITPGVPQKSELIKRILSTDPDEQMPPPDSGKSLTKRETQLLTDWIQSGAKYERHWSFVAPLQGQLPAVQNESWKRNGIDPYILSMLEKNGLAPSPEADRYTLARRVYLDLIGLPPTPTQADEFVNSNDPRAYEKLVDKLLASRMYGEHWARRWLDLARYADTNGYEKDRSRSIWPYRDWVIRAINADMPFDQFSIEQLAGDMLPNATLDQQIATGFHRNTMINEEGGIDPLEYRFYAVVDRVATTGTVWMGLTTGCAQCHSHKYDPLNHTDYYRLFALLNNADEPELIVRDPDVEKKRRLLNQKIAKFETQLPFSFPPSIGDEPKATRRAKNLEKKFRSWLQKERAKAITWKVLRPSSMQTNLPRLEQLPDGSIFSTGDITKRDVFTLRFKLSETDQPLNALRLEVLADDRLPAQGPGRAYYEGRKGDFFLSELTAKLNGTQSPFVSASHSFGKLSIGKGAKASNVFDGEGSTGWSTATQEGQAHRLVLNFAQPLPTDGELEIEMLFERHFAASLGRFRIAGASSSKAVEVSSVPVEIQQLLAMQKTQATQDQLARLRKYYLAVTPHLSNARKQIDVLKKQLPQYPTTMVMRPRPTDNPRATHRHHRGEYLSPRESVTPGVPSFLPQLEESQKPDRLALARWLVSNRNPLAGRVVVNRAWQAFFGDGLVRTPGEFGTQGDSPTHPKLLDWLAVEFTKLENKKGLAWSRKKLHRLIVMSATYRQSSRISADLLVRDRENRFLARGPRFRVDAETVRDILLTASGLLTTKLGGQSVFPPQPASVTALAYGSMKWQVSKGVDRFRRSMYTFRKRTAPFAAYTVFDAPTGENCSVRRSRSNTPLQSLTLLNDSMYLEMARALAERSMATHTTAKSRAIEIFRRLITRHPNEQELARSLRFQQAQIERIKNGELNATTIVGAEKATAELASWFLVARALMNLDETITKQ